MTESECEEIKMKSVEEVRTALAVITSADIYDRKGYLNGKGYQALEKLEGLDLFWICDPRIKIVKEKEAVEKDYQRGYHKGLKVGKRIGAREERKMIIAYIEGKTIEEDQIEQMIKNGEVEAIPYLGETAEEEPNT